MQKSLTHILFAFILTSCVHTKYYPPVQMTQSEISDISLFIKDTYGISQPLTPGRVIDRTDCIDVNGSKECSMIICKKDATTLTQLSCEKHIPIGRHRKTMNISDKDAKIDLEIKKCIQTDVENKNKNCLTNYCLKENVICYLNRKFYPAHKFSTIETGKQSKMKDIYPLNKDESIEISIY